MLITAIVIAFLVCICLWSAFSILKTQRSIAPDLSTAALTLIPLRTFTPTLDVASLNSPTPTLDSTQEAGEIVVGMYVQIANTGGSGLHIRNGPGIDYPPNFIALENEVFKVMGGPEEANDFTWWYLIAPYDEKRNGWAVSNYLIIVQQ